MTATPETVNTVPDKTGHHFLAGLAQQGEYAYGFAMSGHPKEALEHAQAIEGLVAAYRNAVGAVVADTLPEWLYQRFGRRQPAAPEWSVLLDEDKSFWEHEAAAVRRAVGRGGFKPRGEA